LHSIKNKSNLVATNITKTYLEYILFSICCETKARE